MLSETVSFWRENTIAVFIPLRVSANVVMAETSYQMLEVQMLFHKTVF